MEETMIRRAYKDLKPILLTDLIKNASDPDDGQLECLAPYISWDPTWNDDGGVHLDGQFTAKELLDIARWIDHYKKVAEEKS